MIAALLLVVGVQSEVLQLPERAPRTETEVDSVSARWRECLELDLPGTVLAEGTWIAQGEVVNPGLVALYARALHATGETGRARTLLGQAEAPPLALVAARIALDGDEIEAARTLLGPAPGSQSAVRHPDEPESWLLLGRAHARAGEPARAEPLLFEFVRRAPLHVEAPNAWYLLVECARARGDAAEAEQRAQRHRESAEWHAFYRARRLQKREHPEEPLPRLGLAQLWLAAGELRRAELELIALGKLAPDFCRGIELRAEVVRRAGRAAEAGEHCAAALACNPKLVDVHLTLARLARDAGRSDASAASYARYRELGGTRDL